VTKAKDIMQTDVIAVYEDEPLLKVHRLFVDEDISGAPVLDEDDEVVGVISSRDLLGVMSQEHDAAQEDRHYYTGSSSLDDREWLTDIEEFEDRLAKRAVSEAMTTEVISVAPDTTVPEIVKLLLRHRIHRVLVLDDEDDEGPLVGLISLFDLVTLLR